MTQRTAITVVGCISITMMIIIMVYGLYSINQDAKENTKRMQACVSNGGEWRRDMGAYYECVR